MKYQNEKKEADDQTNLNDREILPYDEVINPPNIKVCFVDFPQLINGCSRVDFSELAKNLLMEFDIIYTFARFNGNGKDVPSSYRALSYCGIYPILVPFDPDPIISLEILKLADKLGSKVLIALLSGDKGFFNALLEAKKRGARIKVILPPDNVSTLLTTIADYVSKATDYSTSYDVQKPDIAAEKRPIHEKELSIDRVVNIRMRGMY